MEKSMKKSVLRRLRIVKGQISGIERMIEQNEYCIDVITQSSAAKQALSGVEDVLLENHLSTCATKQMKGGKGDMAVKEILKVYKFSKKT
ncbi:MAG: metal-sensing transcriptional repressor [Patescibacteria group bacterium]|nr:metal-sensing transcriptional repressor [Patescibacteria group bacterium]